MAHLHQAQTLQLLQPAPLTSVHLTANIEVSVRRGKGRLWSEPTRSCGALENKGVRLHCGTCVLLRPWREGDEASLVRHANNYEVWRHLRDRFPRPYTRADAEWWIAFARWQDPQTQFAIEVSGEAAGGIGLELRSDVERCSAEIGYWLGEAFWGKGITTAAVRALSGYGFEAFGLTRIFAIPFASSSASIRVLKKCGYVREGTMRRSAIKEGIVLDQALYSLTDRDLVRPSDLWPDLHL
jgi:ribosomal-protein-alanine N-acetyltransferase